MSDIRSNKATHFIYYSPKMKLHTYHKIRTAIAASLAIAALMFSSCDDNTDTLGNDMMPTADLVSTISQDYNVLTESYGAGDSVLARSSMSYLGRFTDPETGSSIKSDFICQFHCIEDFSFPDSVINDSMISTEVKLYVDSFVGDSLATFKVSVYPLNTVMNADENYYTNIDPTKYYDTTAEPLTVKWYTISDRTVDDDTRNSSSYSNFINIPLPREIGQQIYKAYREKPELFKDTEAFINSGLPCSKGLYFKLESGDGAMAYISLVQFNTNYRYHMIDDDEEVDTTGICQFAATEEVIQATHFENSDLTTLISDHSCTYLKSPAGIFTLATLPADQLNYNDTINSASLTLTRYNDKVSNNGFKLSIPQYVLMVRLDDYLNGFFENYKLSDGLTSYITKYASQGNTYTFSNISHLLNTMMQEKQAGTATANYNKVLLIPVEPTYDTSSSSQTLVKLCHDFSMSSARIVGGDTPLQLKVIYSKFNK